MTTSEPLPGLISGQCTRDELMSAQSDLASGPIGSTARFADLTGQVFTASVGSVRLVDLWVSPVGLVSHGARTDGESSPVAFWPSAMIPAALAKFMAIPRVPNSGAAETLSPGAEVIAASVRTLLTEVADGDYGPRASLAGVGWWSSPEKKVVRLHVPGNGSLWGTVAGDRTVRLKNTMFEHILGSILPSLPSTRQVHEG